MGQPWYLRTLRCHLYRQLLVEGATVPVEAADGWWTVEVTSVLDHEVIALE